MKTALITGITGQDGSYLAELLLEKGYEVHGIVRRASSVNTERIDHIFDPDESKQFLHYGDLAEGIDHLLHELQPDEVYNIASMSHVKVSFEIPLYTGDITGLGAARILEGIRKLGLTKKTKFYQASSSEMFGLTPPPQCETSPFNPVSPYGCAKLYAYHMTRSYRMGYGVFACNGILFNHESERRGVNFVTRKITRGAARIKLGLRDKLVLGNLDAKRDWGHSRDYMEAIHMILQHDKPEDWVVATGEYHTVKEFVIAVFDYFGLDWERYVVTDNIYIRPNEVPALLGDASKIREVLGWKPKILFKDLVKLMCDSDFENEKRNLL
ncbi:MAG: GDPmannose 4,6-dehydratase [Candidatus Berkelbacteria bacterium Licking1014_85]|uniref:GDP-mannose 4,6-dehydratase n=1 Tax=Candidatus Berkelbacteria bacterium Licking1014_85 TaxID=2017148 RepID=A0A554LM29_9BACT|nr:MAG: GDPmannose 4,6-dehydratase [Candidatus Berkelbacteria bacterium Licking1014_85]